MIVGKYRYLRRKLPLHWARPPSFAILRLVDQFTCVYSDVHVAPEGKTKEQEGRSTTLKEAKTIINAKQHSKWLAATASTLHQIGPLPPAIKIRAGCYFQVANRPQPPKPPPLYQVWDQSVRYVPLSDLQYDRRASAAGVPTARHPQASVLAGGYYGGEEAFRQPKGPAAHSSLRAGNRSVHLRVRQEEV